MSVDNEHPGELTAETANTLAGLALPIPSGSGSLFDTNFIASGIESLMEYFAVTVQYTPVVGEIANIQMILLDQGEERDHTENGKTTIRLVVGKLSLADVASPQIGDTVAYGGQTLTVVKLFGAEGGMAEVGLQATEAVERSSAQHRRRYPSRVSRDVRA